MTQFSWFVGSEISIFISQTKLNISKVAMVASQLNFVGVEQEKKTGNKGANSKATLIVLELETIKMLFSSNNPCSLVVTWILYEQRLAQIEVRSRDWLINSA